jgi:hypothetical protein
MKSFRHVGFSGTQGWTLAALFAVGLGLDIELVDTADALDIELVPVTDADVLFGGQDENVVLPTVDKFLVVAGLPYSEGNTLIDSTIERLFSH